MKVLIVEDNAADRDLIKLLLEAKFQHVTTFKEASTLTDAVRILRRETIDCVLLDLSLPDSVGKETFTKIHKQFPELPIVVMTNNKDRSLAIDLVRQGAADYVTKENLVDEETVFRRILIAIEKAKTSIRVTEDAANSVRSLDLARSRLLTAHQSGEFQAIQDSTIETTAATADMARKIFTEVQRLGQKSSVQARDLETLNETMTRLKTEILEGTMDRPSLKSRMDLAEHTIKEVRMCLKEIDEVSRKTNELGSAVSKMTEAVSSLKSAKSEEQQVKLAMIDNKTKVLLAVISLISVLGGALVTKLFEKPPEKPTDKAKVESTK